MMASVLVCDICRKEIKHLDRAGHIKSEPMFDMSDGAKQYDLCLEHYNGMKDIMQQYAKYEQGFLATWPGQTKPLGRY